MTLLAAIEMIARTVAAVALAAYLWDRRRRELASASLRARVARQARLVGACAISAARSMKRGVAAQEGQARAIMRHLRDREPDTPSRAIGFRG